jgi:hypothetical protein
MTKKIFLLNIFLISTIFSSSYAGEYIDYLRKSLLFAGTVVLINLSLVTASTDAKSFSSADFICNDHFCVRTIKSTQSLRQVDSLVQNPFCPADPDNSYKPGFNGYILKK